MYQHSEPSKIETTKFRKFKFVKAIPELSFRAETVPQK